MTTTTAAPTVSPVGRTKIRLEHAPVLQITPEAAHELVTVIVSEIEATEDRLEALGTDPGGEPTPACSSRL